MKTIHAALFLAIVLVASSSSGVMAAKLRGDQYFGQDNCMKVTNLGASSCDSDDCATNCSNNYEGGVGKCYGKQCKCVYPCTTPPPASN
uniref:Knottin scorpion toxin-like domain-containing protein n=1 Tax=Leersia perrieri TaxID=77586 RepID=A0A0D9VLQ7_9ORYZ